MDEWDALPAWQTQMYIEKLQDHGDVVKHPGNTSESGGPAQGVPGKPNVQVDYASGWIPKGFNRRTI